MFRNPYSRNYEDSYNYESVLDPISVTIPDDSYTIPQLFERAVAGYSLTSRDPVYNEDYDHPSEYGDYDLADFDTERKELESRAMERQRRKEKLYRSVAEQSDPYLDGKADVNISKESSGEREGV